MERAEVLFAEREGRLAAFLDEPGRFLRLRREAAELAARFPTPAERPPLYGLLVGVKDIFHVEGFVTRAGSKVPPAELAGPEAASVTALRGAGALVAGKTVTTEFAYFAPGPTRNPVDPERTPGGSSSGSAAAVAAGLCEAALGTQTIGSIVRPASYCGVVGFKPTWGRVSTAGVVPLAPSVDHVGWFAPRVEGASRLAAVLCAGWRSGAAAGGGRPRLAVPRGSYLERASQAARRRLRAACERLARVGWETLEVAALGDFATVEARHRRLVAAEASRVHAGWFARHGAAYHPKTRALIDEGRDVDDATLAADRDGRAELRRELTRAMDEHGVDLWLSPGAPDVAPRGLESTGDPVMNLPWTHAGLPAVGLPLPCAEGELPLGLQVVGREGEDEALLAWAGTLEAALAA